MSASSSSRSLEQPSRPNETCYAHALPIDDATRPPYQEVACTPAVLQNCLAEYQCYDDYFVAFQSGADTCSTWVLWEPMGQPGCSWASACCVDV
jgi:hypothetical protein